jgi:hypothetical protein
MIARVIAAALLALAAGCRPADGGSGRTVVLIVPFERASIDRGLIAGTGEPRRDGPFPDATGLAQALHACGQTTFAVVGGETHREAATFPPARTMSRPSDASPG